MKLTAMITAWRRPLVALAFGVTLAASASSAGWAQMMGGGPVGTTGKAGRVSGAPEKPPEPAAEAIPGAKPRQPAAPATRPAGDMQPTDALFDAINRGDIAAARDALNRGADLNGVSILGMTPMELSVDLGRNDISFLLLSMRGEDSDRGSRAVGRDTPPVPASKSAQAGRPAAHVPVGHDKMAAGKMARGKMATGKAGASAERTAILPNKPAAPKLFANDGGTPMPSAGFLGFDSHSVSN